jgi:hypothetical protein
MNSTSSALVSATDSATASAMLLAGTPRTTSPVLLSFDAGNYTKWEIYIRASLGRAGLIGHIDHTIAAEPTDGPWLADDCTVLDHLHSAIDDDVADMVFASN